MVAHRVRVNGVEIAYEDHGSGPPCLVIHGFTGSAAAMRPLTAGLAGARVLAPDLVGHGSSAAPDTTDAYCFDAMVRQLDAVLDHAGVRRTALVGYSFGARVALSYAVARPDRVDRLITIGGTAGLADPVEAADRRNADEALADDIEEFGIEAFVDRWEQAPIFATQRHLPAATQASIRAGRLANRAVGLANSLRGAGTGAMPSLWDALALVTVPATVVAGELDTKFVDIGTRMADLLPDGRVEVVPGVGHAVHIEAPEACHAIVRAVLETGQGQD